MTGADKDLATWRRVTEQGERAIAELVWTMENVNWRASAARVEAELARLREEQDALEAALGVNERLASSVLSDALDEAEKNYTAPVGEVRRMLAARREALARALAAEARCARLQQALRQIERMAGAAGSGETPAMPLANIAREALAGPDTPADDWHALSPLDGDDTPAEEDSVPMFRDQFSADSQPEEPT